MAKVVPGPHTPLRPVWRPLMIIGAIGLNSGLLYWLLAPVVASSATVIVAAVALVVGVWLRLPRPILPAVATAAALWDLAALGSGLGRGELAIWSLALYLVAYCLFSWLGTLPKLWLAITLSIVIVVGVGLTRLGLAS